MTVRSPHRRVDDRRGRAAALAIAVAILCISSAVGGSARALGSSGEPPITTVTFEPVADARVEEAAPNTNYGASTRLASDGDAGARIESYVRFEVAGVLGTVRSATLRLYVVGDGTADGPVVAPSGTAWAEGAITWETRPRATGPAVADVGAVAPGGWVELDVTPAVAGNGGVSLQLRQTSLDGVQIYSRQGAYRPTLVVTWERDPVVLAAGDIACAPGAVVTAISCRQADTAALLGEEPALAGVLALGDTQYEDGLLAEFTGDGAYDATWGKYKTLTRPVPGNHEYHVPGASEYFEYFGAAAGPAGRGYYSFDIGSWHLIALNSEIDMAAGSPQERWLRDDLAAATADCTLAYWHKPRFSSGAHGSDSGVAPLWDVLYDAKADVILNGHDHDYERFAQQDPDGAADDGGIRQFVVGSGGANHQPFGPVVAANSEVRDSSAFGVLSLVLHRSSYDWRFRAVAGNTFTDVGRDDCHDGPGAVLRVTPVSGRAPLGVLADATRAADAGGATSSYTFDFGDRTAPVGPQPRSVAPHVYTADGTYTVTVTVTDASGRTATATDRVTVKSNLVANPGFESGLAGWNATGSSVTVTRVPGGHSGDWAAAVENGGASAASCVLNDSPDSVRPSSEGVYTASLWVRAETPGSTLRLRLREWSGGLLAGSATTQVTLDREWRQLALSYSPAAPGASSLDLNAYVLGAPPGSCFYADDASVVLMPPERPPAAALAVTPQLGTVPVTVTADASRSTDADATPIASYTFDFGDGSPPVGPQSSPVATHEYGADGSYEVRVTVTDTGGSTATAAATVKVRPNLVRNPGFEVDVAGWNAGPSTTVARVEGGHGGGWAATVSNVGTAPGGCLLNDSPDTVRPSAPGVYTASLWVRAESPGATLKLRLREWSGGALAGAAATQITLEREWQQVAVSYSPVAPGSSTLDLNAYVSNAAPGACFSADDALVFRD